jgi:hypothetical protein
MGGTSGGSQFGLSDLAFSKFGIGTLAQLDDAGIGDF